MISGLSAQQQDAYWRDGVLFPIDVISPEEAAQLLARLDAHFEAATDPDGLGPELEGSPFDRDRHPLNQILLPLVLNEKILACAQSLLKTPILLRGANVFYKRPTGRTAKNVSGPKERGDRYPIQWHWDDPRAPDNGDKVLTAWLALTPSTVQNGCVRYVLGSHRSEIEREDHLDRGALNLERDQWGPIEHLPIADALVEPGQMVIHHASVVHGSASNYSQAPRVGVAFRLFAPDAPRTVTGTGIGVVLDGDLEAFARQHDGDVPVAREAVSFSWWESKRPMNTDALNKSNRYDRIKTEATLIAQLKQAAESGDGAALYALGRMWLTGMAGLETDEARALSSFRRAGEQGDPRGQRIAELLDQPGSMVLSELREASKGVSFLGWASEEDLVMIVKTLVEHGEPVNLRFDQDTQALHLAARRGNLRCMELLLGARAQVRSGRGDGKTPLHLAAEAGWLDACKLLLAHKAIADQVDTQGMTALHLAAAAGHVGACRLLLEQGADPSLRNAAGETARELAQRHGDPMVLSEFEPSASA